MTKSENIAYAIEKECSNYSLIEWCKEWGFTLEDFEKFLSYGIKGFKENSEDSEE